MRDFSDSVMIALLPITTNWSRIDLPHMTLVYAGKIQDQRQTAYSDMLKDARDLAIEHSAITLKVQSMDVFGEGTPDSPKVDVLRLRNTVELMNMRNRVARFNASIHPFNPHVTIGPAGEGTPGNVPGYIAFDRIGVFYGPGEMIFSLRP